MEIKELKSLNLTNGEIKVYSAILKSDIATINKINEKTGLERRGIYDIINKLIQKGLITYKIEDKKKTYQIAPINKLKEQIENKKKELLLLEDKIPEIELLRDAHKAKVNVEIYRGKEGIKTIFEDMLNYKKIYFIGGGFYIMDLFPTFWPNYNRRRIKQKVIWYNLVKYEYKNKAIKTKYMNLKFLPKEFSGEPSVILIYGDKVINVLWDEDLFSFSIESKQISQSYIKYHNFLWTKIAKN
jgi:HTH-type transcriptional regulator, sugar sensing transcriptional regulator